MNLVNALGAIFGGGLTGLIGSAVTAFTEIKKQKMQYEHEEKMQEFAMQTLKLETEAQLKIVEVETTGKIEVADADVFKASFDNDKATYSVGIQKGKVTSFLLVLVDLLRGSVRPIVTYYFTILISIIFFDLFTKYDISGKAESIINDVVLVILYIGTTVILWWFGTRNKMFQNK